MSGSALSCEATVWKPMAGPPVRISIVTPVLCPPDATSGPLTIFVDRRVVTHHVVERAVLGLGEPVGLDHDVVGADALQVHCVVGGCPSTRCGRLCTGRRRGGPLAVVAAAGGGQEGEGQGEGPQRLLPVLHDRCSFSVVRVGVGVASARECRWSIGSSRNGSSRRRPVECLLRPPAAAVRADTPTTTSDGNIPRQRPIGAAVRSRATGRSRGCRSRRRARTR